MKEMLQKVNNDLYLKTAALSSFLLMPNAVFADNKTSLIDANLGTDGSLNIPGASDGGNAVAGTANAFNDIYDVLRVVVQGATGIMAIVMVGVFAYKAFQLSKAGDNPSERSKIIQGMIFFFIGAAAFGAASFLTGLFYNMLR